MSCPICHKATVSRFRPFCSQHCADIDLGRWFRGHYSVPSFRQDNDPEDRAELEREASQARQEDGYGPPPRGRQG